MFEPSYFLNLGWDSKAAYASDLSAEVGPKERFLFNKYVDELNSLGAEFVILKGPVFDTNNTLKIAANEVLSLLDMYSMTWSMNNTVRSLN